MRRLNEQTLQRTWDLYERTGSVAARNRLAEHYDRVVADVVRVLARRLPREVDPGDLAQDGRLGLLEAIRRFDPARRVKFETYAAARVRGAILDAVRERDPMPRAMRARSTRALLARYRLVGELAREPSDEELRRELGLSRRTFEIWRSGGAFGPPGVRRLDEAAYEDDAGDGVPLADLLADRRAEAPEAAAARRALREILFRGLSRVERLVLLCYYVEHMTMKETGAALELSESRVSQTHASILVRLRAALAERGVELVELGRRMARSEM